MLTTAGFALASLLTGADAHHDLAETRDRTSLRGPTVVFALAATADWLSTRRMLAAGGYERNPGLAALDHKPALLIAAGATADVLGVWAWNRFVGRKHPKIAKAGLYLAAGFRLFLTVHNLRLAARLDAHRAKDAR
jgi:hypothetical protein